jgi:hypothetical protein
MEMECICGEVLRGEQSEKGQKELGNLAKQYQEHMNRPDHKSSPAQWATAYERIVAGKERAKKQG